MGALDRFKNQNQKKAEAPAGAANSKFYQPRHSGVKADAHDPYPDPGNYVFEVVATAESPVYPGSGKNGKVKGGTFKAMLRVVESDNGTEVGAIRAYTQKVVGSAQDFGERQVKLFVTAAMGCKDEDELEEKFPNTDDEGRPLKTGWATTWDAASGVAAAEAHAGENPFGGKKVIAEVTRGNARLDDRGQPTGEYFTNWKWAPFEE